MLLFLLLFFDLLHDGLPMEPGGVLCWDGSFDDDFYADKDHDKLKIVIKIMIKIRIKIRIKILIKMGHLMKSSALETNTRVYS